MSEIAWGLIYISLFGISDYFVKKYLHLDIIIFLYYGLLFFIGLWILHKTKFDKYFKNLKLKKNY